MKEWKVKPLNLWHKYVKSSIWNVYSSKSVDGRPDVRPYVNSGVNLSPLRRLMPPLHIFCLNTQFQVWKKMRQKKRGSGSHGNRKSQFYDLRRLMNLCSKEITLSLTALWREIKSVNDIQVVMADGRVPTPNIPLNVWFFLAGLIFYNLNLKKGNNLFQKVYIQ